MAGFDPGRFMARFGREGHTGALKMRYVAHEGDWVELAIDQTAGKVGIGPIAALADMAGLLAVWSENGGRRPVVTIDLRIDSLHRDLTGPAIYARARCHGNGEAVVFVDGVVHRGKYDEPIARFIATYMLASP